ncbi:MAG: TetR/AcrR family transcriptional regulator [Pseudonocardiales bacterium]|nr:TetR/AcrR family transcriptional regulator [Pseudonocardiales bacterium]
MVTDMGGPIDTKPVSNEALDISPGPRSRLGLTVRDELRELTRQRLLTAAETVFEHDGYVRTTIGNIAKLANVNRATFYLHFTDKPDILLAVMRMNLADTPGYWHEIDVALVDGGRAALRAALSNTLRWYQQHGRVLRPVREALATEPHLAEQTEGTFAGFADEMAEYLAGVAPGERERAHLRLQLLIIQLDQIAFRLIVQGLREIDREVMLDEVTDMWRLVLPAAHHPS